MDSVSGADLVISLAALAGSAGLTCQSLWTLQAKFNQIPYETRSLVEDVKILQSLLLSVENSSKINTDVALPPELQTIWQRIERSLRADFESLQELVCQFQQDLDTPSISHDRLLVRLQHASSNGVIARLRRAFKGHIQNLSFIDVLLARRQLITSQEALSTQTDGLVKKISDEFAFCRDEIRAINDVLLEMRDPSTNGAVAPQGPKSQTTNNTTDADLNSQTVIHRGKQRRRIVWKWSLYELPIGTLTTEALLAEEEQQDTPSKEPRRKLRITFNFKPPIWLMDYLLQINYTIATKGNTMPYWQRTQCGALSLLPNELRDCLDEGDCLAAADCFSKISLHDVLRLCESKQLTGVPVPSHMDIMQDPAGRRIFIRACSMSVDARVGPSENSTRSSPKIYTIYTSISIEDQGPQVFVPQRANFHQSTNWLWAYILINDREISRGWPFYPRIGIPVTQDDFHHFVHHIGQHFDPQEALELPKMDRWWVSALMHGVPHFKAFMFSHFASFRSHLSTAEVWPRILDFFEYSIVVEEFLASPPHEQVTFLSFLCVYGTGKMLLPFRNSGYDWHLGGRRNSFLRSAALSHNFETFDVLVEVLRGSTAFKQTLDQELLDEFLGSPFCNYDDGFLNKLLLYMSPSFFQTKAGFMRLRAANVFQSAQIPMDLLAHEEPYRLAGKDEVTLHLIIGLQSERSSNADSLTMAVYWAVDQSLDALLAYQGYLPDSNSAMLNALEQAEANFSVAHPRSVTIFNSKGPQYPLIKTVHLVEENDDVMCCLLLIKALRKLQAFPEQRFANLMDKLAERAATLMADTSNTDSRFSQGSRGALLIAAVIGSYRKIEAADEQNEVAEIMPDGSAKVPALSPPSTKSMIRRWRKSSKPLTASIKELATSTAAFMECTLWRLRSMTLLDYGLLVFGVFASLAGIAEYVLWQALLSMTRVPKPSNAALSAAGVIALGCVCMASGSRISELYEYSRRLVMVEDSQTVRTVVI